MLASTISDANRRIVDCPIRSNFAVLNSAKHCSHLITQSGSSASINTLWIFRCVPRVRNDLGPDSEFVIGDNGLVGRPLGGTAWPLLCLPHQVSLSATLIVAACAVGPVFTQNDDKTANHKATSSEAPQGFLFLNLLLFIWTLYFPHRLFQAQHDAIPLSIPSIGT